MVQRTFPTLPLRASYLHTRFKQIFAMPAINAVAMFDDLNGEDRKSLLSLLIHLM
jgi:hypothetical protein